LIEGKIITTYASADIYVYPHQFKGNVYASLWKYCDLHLAYTNYVANCIKNLGADPASIKILPLGLNVSKFPFRERVADPDGPVKILTVARLVPKKGLEYSIRAFAKVCEMNPSANLVYKIVGEGPERSHLEALIEELGMGDRIFLLGSKNREECSDLYGDAHFYVIPSVTAPDGNKEGQGVALQEAQATGLPVIATDHNGFPEGMVEGESGYLVPERDVEALTEAIDKLVNSPDRWAEMGRAGRRFIECKYDIDRINREFVEICTALVEGGDDG
jgi:colanic acid/amylovoran biosynthesis glycosyltransferase